MGCCELPKFTFSASLVGFVGTDWQQTGLNCKKTKSVDFAPLDPHQEKFQLC